MKRALLLGALCGALALAAESQSLTCPEGSDFAPKGIVKQEDGSLLITTNDGFRTIPAKTIKIDPAKKYELKCEFKLAGAEADNPVRSLVVAVNGSNTAGQVFLGATVSALSGTETEVLEDAPKGATSLKLKNTAGWKAIPKPFLKSFSLAIGAKENFADVPNRQITPHVKQFAVSEEPGEIEFVRPVAFPIPAGTKVRVHIDQASFGIGTRYLKPTAEWQNCTITVLPRQEIAAGKLISPCCWWPGVETAGVFLWVRTVGGKIPSGSGVLIRNLSLAEVE